MNELDQGNMDNPIDWVGELLAVGCLVTSVYLVIYGIYRIKGRFMYSQPEALAMAIWLIGVKDPNKKIARERRKRAIVKNRRWNLVFGISALVASPGMIFMAYIFHQMARMK